MSEFVLVKNRDGDGDMLLKVALIRGAEDTFSDDDSPDGCNVWYEGDRGEETWHGSASTASEVLAAIQEAQGVVPSRVEGTLAVDIGKGQDASRFYFHRSADTSKTNGERITSNTILAGPDPVFLEALAPNAQAREAMEKLGIATYSNQEEHDKVHHYVARESGSLMRWDATSQELERVTVKASVHPVMINPTLEELSRPLCQCAQYQGDNPSCPAHGTGTPWELLHGE